MLESGYDYASLALSIKAWGRELGFQAVGVADTDLSAAEAHINRAQTDEARKQAFEDVLWALVNTKEFLFNH